MKTLLSFCFVLCVINCNIQAQIPSNYVQTPSNMMIPLSSNGVSFSPTNMQYYGNNLPGILIQDYINELIHSQDIFISNVISNGFFNFPTVGVPNINSDVQRFNTNYGKFYFLGSSDIGIDTGIILATERVYYSPALLSGGNAPGIFPGVSHPAFRTSSGASINPGGGPWISLPNKDIHSQRYTQYPELVAINGGDSVWDANVLEFDIIPKGNFISLDYVFASEEWPLFNCQTDGTDVMGIFLSGPGIVGQKNIAVLPGSSTPVNPHTVFPPNTLCHPEAPAGSPWYVDNTGGQNIIFNGFTKVMRAASIVQPCQTYHLKIMIADGAVHQYDTTWAIVGSTWETFMNYYGYESTRKRMLYDSGLMLKMRSLRSMDTVRIEALGGTQTTAQYPYAIRNCLNGKLRLRVQQKLPIARSFTLQFGGTAQQGIDFQTINNTITMPAGDTVVDINIIALNGGSGNKELTVKLLSPYGTCSDWGQYLDSTKLTIADGYYAAVSPIDTSVAAGSSVQLQATGEPFLSYAWSPNAYLNQTNIANPISTPAQSIQYTVTTSAPATYPCPNGSNKVKINVGLGINDVDEAHRISVFPNPSNAYFVLKGGIEKEVYTLKLVDITGKEIANKKGTLSQLNTQLKSLQLANGNYLIQLINKQGKKQEFKVVKQ